MVLEAAAGDIPGRPYPVAPPADPPFVLPIGPIIRPVVRDLETGTDPGTIAARFHATVVRLVAVGAAAIRTSTGIGVVALGGGAFQNGRCCRVPGPGSSRRGSRCSCRNWFPRTMAAFRSAKR